MQLYFIRHGEKEKSSKLDPGLGHTNPPLTKNGETQAAALAPFFAEIPIERILASEYLRARQTARPLAEAKGLEIETDPRLNEIDNGEIELMTADEIGRRYPDFWRDFWSRKVDCRFPGGETSLEVKGRQDALLRELLAAEQSCALFTHEGYIRLLACNILGLPVFDRYKFLCDYCGILELTATDEGFIIGRFNQVVR